MRESTLRELTLRLKNAAPTLQLEENADMARYTTLHLGGPADLMANPDDPAQIPLLIDAARALDVPVTVIGNGSNYFCFVHIIFSLLCFLQSSIII